jgi:hypothetical protein
LYCHCNLPHDQETIDQYMIQCFVCEDWYHNTHLNPTETSTEIDDKYLLICRTCIKSKDPQFKQILMKNKKYFYDTIRAYMDKMEHSDQEEPPI